MALERRTETVVLTLAGRIAAGALSASITVTPNNDLLRESTETVSKG